MSQHNQKSIDSQAKELRKKFVYMKREMRILRYYYYLTLPAHTPFPFFLSRRPRCRHYSRACLKIAQRKVFFIFNFFAPSLRDYLKSFSLHLTLGGIAVKNFSENSSSSLTHAHIYTTAKREECFLPIRKFRCRGNAHEENPIK